MGNTALTRGQSDGPVCCILVAARVCDWGAPVVMVPYLCPGARGPQVIVGLNGCLLLVPNNRYGTNNM
jgi:hypothetical protein